MPNAKSNNVMPRLMIIDSNALAHRAFHAFPSTLKTKSGVFVNAVYGFASMLLQVLNTYKPDYLIFTQDSKEATFRHKLYDKYKANRPKMDELLVGQIPLISDLIDSLGVPRLVMPGFEADDIIGSLVSSGDLDGYQNIIVTGDKDLLQLINDNVQIYLPQSSFSKAVLHNEESAKKKMGFEPKYMIEYKSLRGDPSDNIPGIKGIGDKTAVDLINEFKTLDNVYNNLDKIKESIRKKLIENKKIAYMSRDLAQIKTDLDVSMDLSLAKAEKANYSRLLKFFETYEFYSLIKRINGLAGIEEKAVEKRINPFVSSKKIIKKEEAISQKEIIDVLEKFTTTEEYVFFINNLDNLFQKPIRMVFVDENCANLISCEKLNKDITARVEKLLSNGNAVVYNAKNVYHGLLNIGIKIEKINFKKDLLILDYLISEGLKQTNLEDSLERWMGKIVTQKQQASLFEKEDGYEQACNVMLLNKVLTEEVSKYPKLIALNKDIELPLTKILAVVERNGIKLDSNYLFEFERELDESLKNISEEIFENVGESFNLSSPKQLGVILYEKLKLPNPKKTKGGGKSTDEKVLMDYVKDYPIISKILQYRELYKLKSTYTNTLIKEINSQTGRVHTTFNQAVVATGRLSSKDPNLQNIPTSSELGQKIRNAFISEEKKILVSFDYAQQELRLLAHLSREDKLLQVFRNNIDIHTATASNLFSLPIDKVLKKHRRIGKTVNFGVVYGISAFGLADRLKIGTGEAQKFINSFFESFPKVKVYFEELKANARNLGYVETLFGRRKNALGLNNPNFQIRMGKEREIINFPLQGSAADIMKLAMIASQKYIDELNDPEVKMVLQVHDELIFEIPEDIGFSNKFIAKIREIMMNVCHLDIPLNVEAGVAKRWGDLK